MSEHPTAWAALLAAAEEGDSERLGELLDALDESERVHALAHLDSEERGTVLAALDPGSAAELIEYLPESHATEALHEISPDSAAQILDEMDSDRRADLVGRLTTASAEAIVSASSPDTARSLRTLLQYPAESAGGLMLTEYAAVPASWTVRQLLAHLQENVERYSDYAVQYVYALDDQDKLIGVLPLRNLLLARTDRSVASLMIREPIAVSAQASLPELFELFDRYGFVGLPVVNEQAQLVGVLLREKVDEARVDQAQSDELKSRGIVGGEELRTMPVLSRSWRRMRWLSLNIVLNIAAASVIALYQETLVAAVALAVFLPIISDMSGCSGNQAVAVSLRELSLGVVRPSELLAVWSKEISVGCLNGVALGLLIGLAGWLWQGNPFLGAVVGIALAVNTMVAVSIGGMIPLALRRFGIDPALAASPILTTVTDMCGFFFLLSLASLVLHRL